MLSKAMRSRFSRAASEAAAAGMVVVVADGISMDFCSMPRLSKFRWCLARSCCSCSSSLPDRERSCSSVSESLDTALSTVSLMSFLTPSSWSGRGADRSQKGLGERALGAPGRQRPGRPAGTACTAGTAGTEPDAGICAADGASKPRSDGSGRGASPAEKLVEVPRGLNAPQATKGSTVGSNTHITAPALEVPWHLYAPGCEGRQSALACSERNHIGREPSFMPFRASEGEVQIAAARRAHRRQPCVKNFFASPALPNSGSA